MLDPLQYLLEEENEPINEAQANSKKIEAWITTAMEELQGIAGLRHSDKAQVPVDRLVREHLETAGKMLTMAAKEMLKETESSERVEDIADDITYWLRNAKQLKK